MYALFNKPVHLPSTLLRKLFLNAEQFERPAREQPYFSVISKMRLTP